jgi:UDP-glucose:(glucosyl)LPS alpha-1,2-glucosyltransferase
MKYNISEPQSLAGNDDYIDKLTGLSHKSRGGSELMYERITKGLGPEYTDRFQFISSRVRELDPNKKKILILNDTFDDPESQHLKDPASRARFDHLAFVSNYQFNTYNMALGVPFDHSTIMRNAIVPFEEHEKPPIVDGNVRLIYHTTPHRGLELLIPVFLEVVKHRPNVTLDVYSSFDIYGWPQRNAPYEKIFDICRNHPNINYFGSVSNDRVRAALRASHIFAYPNIWPETSCIAAIEAMSAGCAVLAPDHAALPETLSTYGYMYRFTENVQKHMNVFANYLISLIDQYESEQVQNNLTYGIRYAKTHYNIADRVVQWKLLLDSLSK